MNDIRQITIFFQIWYLSFSLISSYVIYNISERYYKYFFFLFIIFMIILLNIINLILEKEKLKIIFLNVESGLD